MSTWKSILTAVFVCFLAFATASCEQEGPAEKTGKSVDEAVEKTGEKMEEAGEAAEERLEEAHEANQEAAQEAVEEKKE
jgi:nucleoid-associated protein YgaU